ncbi:SpoIIE family protein phosphatase [Streptomyces sp. NPDC048420]|uniref:SpoIIE family protein phosphatase n=1 Tax=Streptomyces sp. NPDC048420 TaxID=3155755 RepID=UPI00343835B8
MGAIPVQRESVARASDAPVTGGAAFPPAPAQTHATLSGSPLAPGSARALLRGALTEWAELGLPGAEFLTDRQGDDAVVVVSELVTNAVVHAGTDVELSCRLEARTGGLVVEVLDHHPSRAPRWGPPGAGEPPNESGRGPEPSYGTPEYGRGLRLVAALAESWGITYRTGAKTVWARLPAGGKEALDGIQAYAEEGTQEREVRATGERGREVLAAEERGRESRPAEERGRGSRAGGEHGNEWRSCAVSGTGDERGSGPAEEHAQRPRPVGEDAQESLPAGEDAHGALPVEEDAQESPPAGEHRQGLPPAGEHRQGLPPAGEQTLDWEALAGGERWLNRGALSFLAEASDLLAGQLDENLVAALAGQLIVPRLADWCAVWLEDEVAGRWGSPRPGEAESGWGEGVLPGPRLARVWHGSENRIEELRRALENEPPWPSSGRDHPGPESFPWPGEALGPHGTRGSALAYRLTAGGRPLGTLVIGRAGLSAFPDEITGLVEDLSRRVALAIGAARQYARQATISAVLQRGLLPGAVAEIPGVRSALVYEPCDKGGPSGDFYDLFPAGDGRWCFAVGDVQGKGPEAAVVIGLARPWLRLLAREGYRVADVLDRLNQLLLDDATEAADAAARALASAGGRPPRPGDGPQTRFLSLLYGELAPFDGGVRCTLASAGHPLPLLLGAAGEVRTAARPQTLLGVVEDETYTSETFELRPGDSLLCVTDGVTERRSGSRQFDDENGLAEALAGCAGLDAELIAERIKRLVHEFGARPPEDDLALLVLQAE